MSENVVMLPAERGRAGAPAGRRGRKLSSAREVAEAFSRGRGATYWVADGVSTLLETLAAGHVPGGDNFLVVCGAVNAMRHAVLDAAFQRVVVQDRSTHLLPFGELAEVLAQPSRDELFIGGVVDRQDEVVVLYRGSLEALLVPFAWFTPSGSGVGPDFADFEVTDFGQTVRLGEYEAAADAVLYEFDAEYRRRARKRMRAEDSSFGACLRRLRMQKGVGRDEFPGISAKQIARLERGETARPRASTLATIAARLGVEPGEIEEY